MAVDVLLFARNPCWFLFRNLFVNDVNCECFILSNSFPGSFIWLIGFDKVIGGISTIYCMLTRLFYHHVEILQMQQCQQIKCFFKAIC